MYSVDAIPCQGIQPLSLAAQILYAAIQLPLHRGAKIRAQYASAAPPLQNVPARRAHLNFAPKGVQNITRGFAADITAQRARYNFSPQAKNITEIRRLAAALFKPKEK